MRLLYDVCFFIFAIFYLPFFLMKGKHKGGFSERLGRVPPEVRENLRGRKVVWVHAVSVGEVVGAVRLVNVLREGLRDARFLLTTTTATGREVAQKLKNDEDTVLYFPIDFRFAVRAFIKSVSPAACVVLETEIWPNVIFELSKRKVPLFLVNGRISDKAIARYRKIKRFIKPLLNRFTAIAVQDERMKSRFLELGADPRLVSVTGNMKFDWQQEVSHKDIVDKIGGVFKGRGSFLCIAGSTHEGEEEALFDVYNSVKAGFPFFKLLIAPRHLDRMESIQNKAAKKGIVLKKASGILNGKDKEAAGAVLVLDRMGVLASVYQLADAVFVGGSLVPWGGHNLVEPAFFERAILFGPGMTNFREMAEEFKKADAAIEVKDKGDLERKLVALIQDEKRRMALGKAAKELVLKHQGATEKNAEVILKSMGISQ